MWTYLPIANKFKYKGQMKIIILTSIFQQITSLNVQIKRKLSEMVVQFLTEPIFKAKILVLPFDLFVLNKGKYVLDLFENGRKMACGMNKNMTNLYFCRMVVTKESKNNDIENLPYFMKKGLEEIIILVCKT